jgi:hypothetical protein
VEGLSYKKGNPFQGKWYTIDKLLKSALRDQKSKELIEKRDEEQKDTDKKHEKEENERVDREIKKNQKRLLKLKDAGLIVGPSVSKGIAQRKKMKIKAEILAKQDKDLNDIQQAYEKDVKDRGEKLIEEEPAALRWAAAEQRDDEYDPIANIQDLDDEDEAPKRKPRPKRKKRRPKPKPKAEADESTDEEKSSEPKKQKKRKPKKKKPKVDQADRRRLIDAFKAKGLDLLKLQKRGFEGKNFEAKILKFNDVMKEGRAIGDEIKKKKYNHKLNIDFFNQ